MKLCIVFVVVLCLAWQLVTSDHGCTPKEICKPKGNYTECLKNRTQTVCIEIYEPVCGFNGFEHKLYDNECFLTKDQQCRKDVFVRVPRPCCAT